MKHRLLILVALLLVLLPMRSRALVESPFVAHPVYAAENERDDGGSTGEEVKQPSSEPQEGAADSEESVGGPATEDTVPPDTTTIAPNPTTQDSGTQNTQAIPVDTMAEKPPNTADQQQPDIVTVGTEAQPKAISSAFPWAWVVTRAAGIISYILLALLSLTGMLLTTGLLYRVWSPATAWSVHRAIGSMLLLTVLAHIAGLLTDNFIKLSFLNVFVPFTSPYRPLLVSLGIGGFYLLLLILASSLYTMTSHARFWRTIHFFGFPMFALIFLHGILIGTDSKQPWMIAIYWITAGLVVAGVVYRLVWKYTTPKVTPKEERNDNPYSHKGG